MRAWLAKVSRGHRVGLIPTDDPGRELLRKMAEGECAEFTSIRPRSLPWHRMYFGICRMIGENQDPPRDESSIDYELRILSGHYEVMRVGENPGVDLLRRVHTIAAKLLPSLLRKQFEALIEQLAKGAEVRVPKRIAFDKMDGDEWAEYWRKVEQAIVARFGSEYIVEIGRAA